MKIICEYCKGKGGRYHNINGRLMHFPCEHCQHHGYLTLIRHIDKYGFKHTIKNILTRGNRK